MGVETVEQLDTGLMGVENTYWELMYSDCLEQCGLLIVGRLSQVLESEAYLDMG